MSEGQLVDYGEREYAKLAQAFGPTLDSKIQSAARMIDALEQTRPGLKQLLKTRGIGDNGMGVSMLIQEAERWEIRHKR